MDANGLRLWMLRQPGDWTLPADGTAETDEGGVRLASRRVARGLAEDDVEGVTSRPVPNDAADPAGRIATCDGNAVLLSRPNRVAEGFKLAPGPVTSVALSGGVLFAAHGGAVTLIDARARWEKTKAEGAFVAARLAPAPDGECWAMDADGNLARIIGSPLPTLARSIPGADDFVVCAPPPAVRVVPVEKAPWDPGAETFVAFAAGPEGQLAVLSSDAGNTAAFVRLWSNGYSRRFTLAGVTAPFSIAYTGPDHLAVLVAGPHEAPVYRIDRGLETWNPSGDFYPLVNAAPTPFLAASDGRAIYRTRDGSTRILQRLPLPSFTRRAEIAAARVIRAEDPRTVWHRLYIEACIPPRTAIRVHLAPSDDGDPNGPLEWSEHRFGAAEMFRGEPGVRGAAVPRATSEVPFHPGFLSHEPRPGTSGLFTALIQRGGRAVSSLRGRFLHIKVILEGDGRATPELAALRVHASRFSYIDRYLPELYRETEFGPDADRAGDPSRSDFLERFLSNMEGLLTPLEDRIANAHLLTHPRTVPDESLDWLANWVGMQFEPGYPADRRRRCLEMAPELLRRRGTQRGLELAIDAATGGMAGRGAVIVVENYRLRRTFATILGARLEDRVFESLLPGAEPGGNSVVGDTLFLGDESERIFLSAFAPELVNRSARDSRAVAAFLDSLAHRVTVLVHDEVEPADLGLIRAIVERERPAHVLASVVPAAWSFLAGVASLVGVDTYIAPPLPRPPVRPGFTRLGEGFVFHEDF